MTLGRRIYLIAALVAIIAIAGVAVTATSQFTFAGGDDSTPITGAALERASAAALAHTGGGRVTDTEVGDEDSYYEVEVTLPDGRQTDVQLDKDFNVVGADDDDEEADDGDADD